MRPFLLSIKDEYRYKNNNTNKMRDYIPLDCQPQKNLQDQLVLLLEAVDFDFVERALVGEMALLLQAHLCFRYNRKRSKSVKKRTK